MYSNSAVEAVDILEDIYPTWTVDIVHACLLPQLCPAFCTPMDCSPPVLLDSPGKNTGVGSHSLLQGIFPTQEWNLVSCIAGGFFTM